MTGICFSLKVGEVKTNHCRRAPYADLRVWSLTGGRLFPTSETVTYPGPIAPYPAKLCLMFIGKETFSPNSHGRKLLLIT